MLRLTSFVLLCFAVTLGWATPIGKALGERDPEYNLDLFEGDIMGVAPGEQPRSAVVDPTLLWPNGIVYYTVDEPAFTAQELATLMEAFAIYEANSCIRFVQRTTEEYYVSVEKTGGGCYSYIGRRPRILQPQTLSLDAGCFRCTVSGCKPGTPQHEFLHALGFYHEQSRTDRDDYVTINYDNIQPGYENNFQSYGTDVITDQGFPYDYGSVMHYSAYAFAVDPSIPTIIVPDGVSIGQRDGFSELDLAELNKLYGCAAKK
ncbi:hatching enzyme 1.2-like [Daphnia pulex]|uniref:hatching enzyme 1.2-like n=1 Tax=Daphnia pulex TaxID=6669 RepID=UPI001EDE3840|nr:hatching enzyme 1.2-like [Daphnia pulex]XP_046645315.1 hatching enzyme 1.2-like [Daphnia pulicaria]